MTRYLRVLTIIRLDENALKLIYEICAVNTLKHSITNLKLIYIRLIMYYAILNHNTAKFKQVYFWNVYEIF